MKLKNWLVLSVMGLAVFGLSLFAICKPADAYSLSERRSLAQFPTLSADTVESGRFMTDFETYSQDQFPMREAFRRLKAISARYGLQLADNHGLYQKDGYVSKLEYPLKPVMLDHATELFGKIYREQIQDTACQVYLSIIPDKNYFLAPLGGYPAMDYGKIVQTMREQMPYADYLDIFDLLSLGDYYYTDQHWRQEAIFDVAERLAQGMGTELDAELQMHELDTPFYGAYVGQLALPTKSDTITYLTNAATEGAVVTGYGSGRAQSMQLYDLEKGGGKDPYELFLGGAQPLIEMENPNAATDRELVIFRDSFGSSLTPLLLSGYAKVTLIDLRYLNSKVLDRYVRFDKQDVLFCYSTLILNNSTAMQ